MRKVNRLFAMLPLSCTVISLSHTGDFAWLLIFWQAYMSRFANKYPAVYIYIASYSLTVLGSLKDCLP